MYFHENLFEIEKIIIWQFTDSTNFKDVWVHTK